MRTAVFVVVIFVLGACIHAAPEPQPNPSPSAITTATQPDPELAILTEQFLKDEPPCSSLPVPQGHVVISQAGFQVYRTTKNQRSVDTIVTPPHGERQCRAQILASPEGLRCKTAHDRPSYRCRPVGFVGLNNATYLVTRQQIYRYTREDAGIADFTLIADFGEIEFAGSSPTGDAFVALKNSEFVGILFFEGGRWQIFPPRGILTKKNRSMLAMDIAKLDRTKGKKNQFVLSFTDRHKLIVTVDDRPIEAIADNR